MGMAGPAGTAFTNVSTFVYLAIPPLVHLFLRFALFDCLTVDLAHEEYGTVRPSHLVR